MELALCANEASRFNDDVEADLVEKAKHDREAFAQLYRRYYPTMAAYLLRRTGDVHAAQDLVSDVFLTVMRDLPRYRQRGVPFRYWVYRIATNAANRWAKTRKRYARAHLGDQDIVDPTSELDLGESVDLQRAIRALLDLPGKHQAVLALYHIENLSVQQISLVLGCRPGTVKSRLSRARDALRAKLT